MIPWSGLPSLLLHPRWIFLQSRFHGSCISSARFSFLFNGQPLSWLSAPKEVRQGIPISPYLFILISQNLTAIINYVLRTNMVLGFDIRLLNNFNHLMYADDLILITEASRLAAKNIKFCVSIYSQLTSQNPNTSKSVIYFPKCLIRGQLEGSVTF